MVSSISLTCSFNETNGGRALLVTVTVKVWWSIIFFADIERNWKVSFFSSSFAILISLLVLFSTLSALVSLFFAFFSLCLYLSFFLSFTYLGINYISIISPALSTMFTLLCLCVCVCQSWWHHLPAICMAEARKTLCLHFCEQLAQLIESHSHAWFCSWPTRYIMPFHAYQDKGSAAICRWMVSYGLFVCDTGRLFTRPECENNVKLVKVFKAFYGEGEAGLIGHNRVI